MHTTKTKLGELLIAGGALDREALDRLLVRQRDEHRRLGELVLEAGLATEESLRRVLAEQHGLEAVDLAAHPPDRAALALVPTDLIRRVEAVPLAVEGQRLFVGMVDPENALSREEIRFASGFSDLRLAVVTASDFARFVRQELNSGTALEEALDRGEEASIVVESPATRPAEASVEAESPAVVSLVDHVLSVALLRDATEIHVEPFDTAARIRLRSDGQLSTLLTVPRRLHAALVARIRQLGSSENGGGQLLRVARPAGASTRQLSFRVSALEAAWGTALTLRRVEIEPRPLQDVGLPTRTRARLSKALSPLEGLVLVVGPRESGRSTTAGAIARFVNHPARQVVLVSRDGVVAAPGALAVPVARPSDLPAVLEAVVAQNPDVIAIDGIDGETARAAVRAALDGHLVIATMTASRATEALHLLVGAGVPPWQLAASLQAVVAQRLVRAVHETCAAAYEPSHAELEEFSLPREILERAKFRAARGCAKCHGTGYLGRALISEALFPTSALREAIRDGASRARLQELAREDGFTTVWEEGIVEASKGRTTFEELRATLSGRD